MPYEINHTAGRVVLATFGTHGDLNPFIAIALALQELGLIPVIASHAEYRPLVETAGIAFHPVRPSRAQIELDSAATLQRMMRAVRHRPQILLRRYVLPYLEQSYEDVLAAAHDARLILTSALSFGARIAAEALGIPQMPVVLQPGMLWSAYDPPQLTTNATFNRLLYAGGPAINRILLHAVRRLTRRWVRPVEQFRAHLGHCNKRHPLFEGQWEGVPVVGLYSSVLGERQPDHPPQLAITGFPFYDGGGPLSPGLREFLAEDSSPLVFTFGTSAVHDSQRFVEIALQALASMRCRALFVVDDAQRAQWPRHLPETICVTGYAPYSKIFPRARVIIHHGGIGTTAQALRAGRPQLVAPYFVDQPDNAARVARLRVGRVLPLNRWTPARLTGALNALLNDPQIAVCAASIALRVAGEQGAQTAARVAAEQLAPQRNN